MLRVGSLFDLGHGVPQDYTEAMRWYEKAADAGNAFALVQIGSMYVFGHGVPKDNEQARIWMKKAAVSDDMIAHDSANQWLIDHPSP
jgi:TPR repeat protein